MNIVELYTTQDCGLCREARDLLLRLQKEYPFRLDEKLLKEDHPNYKEYLVAVPVVIVQRAETLTGKIHEKDLRAAMKKRFRPSRTILVAKFLEALGFLTVGAGLFYGVTRNDEWAELYFLIAGLLFFAVGRLLERREMKKAKS
jgi:hypothetical protein